MDFPLLMGYDFCLSLFRSFSPSFFFLFFLSHEISLILVGIIADSVGTLPHVMKYQTVIPQKLKDSFLIDDAATHQVTHTLLFLFYHLI